VNQLRFHSCALTATLVSALTLAGCASVNAPIAQQSQPQVSAGKNCAAHPLGKRNLYLRGTFNGWGTAEAQKFTYFCDRFELVTGLKGEQTFKVGDEDWSADADFGVAKTATGTNMPPWTLTRKGDGIRHTFNGNHRLTLKMTDTTNPTLNISSCDAPPLGDTTLYLRGNMNNWTALDDYAFQFSCDAYYLNVKLNGRLEFKIADAKMSDATTLGADGAADLGVDKPQVLSAADAGGRGNLNFAFAGEHTIRLAYAGNRPVITIGAKTFADPREVAVTDPVALSLTHDSRDNANKSPFGAVVTGTAVNFSIAANAGVESAVLVIEKRRMEGNQDVLEYTEVARLPLTKSAEGGSERWSGTHRFDGIGVYGYYFETVIAGKTFIYQNNRESVYWTREKGGNGLGAVEEKPASSKTIRRFRHTVFAKDFVVPAWAKDVVYYYIFPERFRNGDKRNDPKPGVTTYQNHGVEFHQNWLDKPYRPKTSDGSDDVYNNDFFGGDLAGIIDKLDYIADLGANTIYMTPIFQAASNHKYDTADFKNIDPHFGTNADFERLTSEAAKRGIRVIPDTSLNHVGSDSIYFDRYGKYKSQGAFEGAKVKRDSPYASWFKFDESQSDPNKQYKGWVDVTDLPEVDKSSPSFREFAYGAKDSVMKMWLDKGAAGWRMDVAPWVPDDFWRPWRAAIKQHKPDALTISETWFDSSKYFLGDAFDTTMNYIFRNTILEYANGGKAKNLYHNIELIREVYPPQSFYALMNLTSSHDQPRALHQFGYIDDKSDAAAITLAKQRQRLTVFFQMIFPGAPTIYYGDEVGVTGGEDPYNRATYPWADLGGKPDNALLADFKTLIKMRKDHAVLRHGSIDAPIFIDDNVIVLLRKLNDIWAITATNNAADSKTVTVKLPEPGGKSFANALTKDIVNTTNGSITFTIPPLFGTVLITP
jgi:cyclomaltodextrinase / maltogenic alpha-amylase / neopullulanase